MFRFASSIWVLVCNFFFHLFGYILKYTSRYVYVAFLGYIYIYISIYIYIYILAFNSLIRIIGYFIFCRYQVDDSSVHSRQDDEAASNSPTVSVSNGFGEKENCEFSSGFQFQNSEDSNKRVGETESSVFMETLSTLSTNKYQFISGKDFSGFMTEAETMSFTVQQLFVGPIPNDASIINYRNQKTAISSDKDFRELNFQEKDQQLRVGSNDASIGNNQGIDTRFSAMEGFQELNSKAETVDEEKAEDSVQSLCKEEIFEKQEQISSIEDELHENKDLTGLVTDSLGKHNFSDEDKLRLEEITEAIVSIDAEASEPNLGYSDELHKESFSGKSLGEVESKLELENIYGEEKSEEAIPSSERKLWASERDSEDGLEILWEHQDLIEQMKMELRNARSSRGLPTILEESETPKMMEDLKPLKIDEKFEHKDRMEEIQKVYKSYAEKMRKLDILNYQTMHAISFLQLKDPVQLPTKQRTVSAIKSLLFPSFWPRKLQRIFADPTLKSITELHRDLELVYVGQVCLSWEILQWQYVKAKELLEHDSQGHRPYNLVAGEFQQFQVIVQRFVENEQFQGPRIQNYVKNRCFLRVPLQVPAIKDDCMKDKKESRVEGKDVISIAMLTEIIEASMHVFWEFLRLDKDEANAIVKGLQGTHVDLQNPSDSELLMDIKTTLQKKERRLKDLIRSGNCIVKKFQKHQEGRLDHAMFFAQVELRLVSRVLNMSRLTSDQLVWCHKKLNKINFVSRKIHIEPSFLLFPF
ncbi:hypothetical protein F0562_032905 [Nyssa sinensis]|uniref:Ribosomal protein L34Ae n=1 Tax=Nyssa sinensis TaxID=561372 RepID=A0A5J5ARU6_9ASTE|nr:hypothetical protein F0562_032905 [Nyssa sinensis]